MSGGGYGSLLVGLGLGMLVTLVLGLATWGREQRMRREEEQEQRDDGTASREDT